MLGQLRRDKGAKDVSKFSIRAIIVPRQSIKYVIVVPPEPLAVVLDTAGDEAFGMATSNFLADNSLDGFLRVLREV